MAKWWHVSWKRLALLLVGTFAGLWLLAGAVRLVMDQLQPWLFTRHLKQQTPQLAQIPIALPDQSLVPLDGKPIEFYGVSMATPWKEISRQHAFPSVSNWNFKDGASLLVISPFEADHLAMPDDPRVARALGTESLRPGYALMNAEMYSTPDDVKWWKLPKQNARAGTLVLQKAFNQCHNYGKFYSVSFGRLRGFQEGAPTVAPYKIHLDLFDAGDRHYDITILGDKGKPIPLTQAQLNSMIASIQADPKQ